MEAKGELASAASMSARWDDTLQGTCDDASSDDDSDHDMHEHGHAAPRSFRRRASRMGDMVKEEDAREADAKHALEERSQEQYTTACGDLNTIPSSYILSGLQGGATLALRDSALRDKGIIPLAMAMGCSPCVTALDLSGNRITDRSMGALADALTTNTALHILDLSKNLITDVGGRTLAPSFAANTGIVELNMSNNKLSDGFVHALVESLPSNKTLRKLDLSGNELRYASGARLGALLHAHRALHELHLGWNQLMERGVDGMAVTAFKNPRLTVLDLSMNGISGEVGVTLGTLLSRNNSLRLLDLSRNKLGPKCATSIHGALKLANETLSTLKLGFNPFGDEATLRLVRATLRHPKLARLAVENTASLYSMPSILLEASRVVRYKRHSIKIACEYPERDRVSSEAQHISATQNRRVDSMDDYQDWLSEMCRLEYIEGAAVEREKIVISRLSDAEYAKYRRMMKKMMEEDMKREAKLDALHERMKSRESVGALKVLHGLVHHLKVQGLRMVDIFSATAGFDTDGDNRFDIEEHITLCRIIDPKLTRAQSRRVFNFIDSDSSGYIDALELDTAVRLMQQDEHQIRQLERMLRHRKTGALHILEELGRIMGENDWTVSDLFFKVGFDETGDGVLDAGELMSMCKVLGIELNEQKAHMLLSILDETGDAVIEIWELELAIKNMEEARNQIYGNHTASRRKTMHSLLENGAEMSMTKVLKEKEMHKLMAQTAEAKAAGNEAKASEKAVGASETAVKAKKTKKKGRRKSVAAAAQAKTPKAAKRKAAKG